MTTIIDRGIQNLHCRGAEVTNDAGGFTDSGGSRGSTARGGGGGNQIFLKNGCKWCILSPFVCEFVLISPPELCVIFAFKAPIFDIRDAVEFLP